MQLLRMRDLWQIGRGIHFPHQRLRKSNRLQKGNGSESSGLEGFRSTISEEGEHVPSFDTSLRHVQNAWPYD